MNDLTLDELARRVFPKFDHDDKSELNMAVWEKIKATVGEVLSDLDGNYAERLIAEDQSLDIEGEP